MAREDIIGGLKSALIRGYSLKDAMISFYNAGYKKEDIEDAARKIQYQLTEDPGLKDLILQNNSQALNPKGVSLPKRQRITRNSSRNSPNPGLLERTSSALISNKNSGHDKSDSNKTADKAFRSLSTYNQKEGGRSANVSAYKPGTGMKVITIVLIILLVLLLGLMAAIFIFKNQIIGFFNNLLTG